MGASPRRCARKEPRDLESGIMEAETEWHRHTFTRTWLSFLRAAALTVEYSNKFRYPMPAVKPICTSDNKSIFCVPIKKPIEFGCIICQRKEYQKQHDEMMKLLEMKEKNVLPAKASPVATAAQLKF